eukprot:Clim_evm23s172 gene=Clim_evmTU23s172
MSSRPVYTADLWDKFGDHGRGDHDYENGVQPKLFAVDGTVPFRFYGGKMEFEGRIRTVKCHEDNGEVRRMVSTKVDEPSILVVDGAASGRTALAGGKLGELAVKNGWTGLIVYGCIRDTLEMAEMPLGIRALGTSPVRCIKRKTGLVDYPVEFGGVRFMPGDYCWVDVDGIVVSSEKLQL